MACADSNMCVGLRKDDGDKTKQPRIYEAQPQHEKCAALNFLSHSKLDFLLTIRDHLVGSKG